MILINIECQTGQSAKGSNGILIAELLFEILIEPIFDVVPKILGFQKGWILKLWL